MPAASGSPRHDLPLMERLRRVDTSSLSDADKTLRVLPSGIRPLVHGRRLLGRAVTADAHDDLMSVIAGLSQAGEGDVLVVAAGDAGLAVAGELFATEAVRRGLAGIVIDGLCRDTGTLRRLDLPVYARGATPLAGPAVAVPEDQVPVLIGSVEVRPGDLVVGDDDGIVVADTHQLEAAIDTAEAIQVREEALLASMADGASLFDAMNFEEHVAATRAGQASALSFGG